MTMPTPLQTAEGRLQALRQAAIEFSKHLETVPGAALTPEFRLGVFIASCAREALSCKACADMQQTCLLKSASFYSACSGLKHYAPITCKNNKQAATCLTSIVHAIVNQQSKITHAWFEDAIHAIKESGVVSEGFHDEQGMELACYSALAEIVSLTTVWNGLHEAFLALDEETPPLPTKAAPGPTNEEDIAVHAYSTKPSSWFMPCPRRSHHV